MAFAEATRPQTRITDWVKHGLIGGVIAGLVFAMFEMVMAAILNGAGAFFMPLRMIGAMLLGQQALQPDYSLVAAALAGVGVHMTLSMMFGLGVAAAARYVPALAASTTALLAWTSLAGLGLWIVNFYIIAPIAGWNWFPDNTNPAVQFVAHTFFYGTVLGVYLNATSRRSA